MRSTALLLTITLLGSFAGCSGWKEPIPATLHNGAMFALPGKKGFFEVNVRGDAPAARGVRAKGVKNAIIVYFYQLDGTTPMSPAPTNVTVKVATGDAIPAVTLSTQSSDGGFVSSPGHFPAGFRGQLSATIDGEDVESPFLIR